MKRSLAKSSAVFCRNVHVPTITARWSCRACDLRPSEISCARVQQCVRKAIGLEG